MTVLKVCGNSERGDLDFVDDKQDHNHPRKEEGKRSYSCGRNLTNYTGEYCNSTTIHGIRYFGEDRTWIEKLWWTISITMSLYFCISLVIRAYIRWENSPVIVSFATQETAVWKIPFPAVTICPESKTKPSVFNYTYYLHKKQDNEKLTEDEERKFGYLSFICDTQSDLNYTSGKLADQRMLEFFEEIEPNFYENSLDCKYLGKSYNCSELFVPVLTDDGICYTFNIMDRTQILSDIVEHYKHFHSTKVSDDWSIENGYSTTAGLNAYPRRALIAGIPYALEVKLTVHEDNLDYTCGTSVKGFKVQIAHPQRIPRVRHQHFVVPLEKVAKVGIAPDMMTTSKSVQAYKPTRRNCHFPTERHLKYFKVYTQNNCAIECRANYTFKQCGCVPFYVPREKSVPICGPESHTCLRNTISKMLQVSIQRKINNLNHVNSLEDEELPNCQCLPICTSMYYDIENTQGDWNWRTIFKYNRHSYVNISDEKIKMSKLQIFFKGNQFITSERNELYGSTEFLANVGGLLGLFIGFSAMSFIEIVYYLSLRIICNIHIFGIRNWSGTSD